MKQSLSLDRVLDLLCIRLTGRRRLWFRFTTVLVSALTLLFSVAAFSAAAANNNAAEDPAGTDGSPMAKTGTLFGPYVEWSYSNGSYSGNPFDLVAEVTFRHQGSGTTRTTQMFYAGNDTWKFRFTGTRTGTWTFSTSSGDSDLDGISGSVDIRAKSDSDARGFLSTEGNNFVQQVDENTVKPVVYMPFLDWNGDIAGQFGCGNIENLSCWNEDLIRAYARKAKDHGMSHIFLFVGNQWFKPDARRHHQHNSENPSLESFRQIEQAIQTAREEGIGVHMWAWGDESRSQTQVGLPGGINGRVDKRLQRYIAARLAPLPGWTMGYGYDLREWVSHTQANEWAGYMHEHMGWDHLLWARGREGDNFDVESVGLVGPDSYSQARDHATTSRPHLEEERFLYRREFRGVRYTMDHTTDLMWWMAMASGGGSHGFWGTDEGEYSNPEWLQTFSRFWNQHLQVDFSVDNNITNGRGLKTSDNSHYIVYKEGTSSIDVDLRGMDGSQPAVAIDTRSSYREIDLGTVDPGRFSWDAPRSSDWVIAFGEKGGRQQEEDNDDGGTSEPLTGNIRVDASTGGDDLDSDGYEISLDGSGSQSIGADGSVTFENLSTGDHSVALSGLASNCSVDGSRQVTVEVSGGSTARHEYSVTCSAITVTEPDPEPEPEPDPDSDYLLDRYPDAYAAYSLRQLRSGFDGPAIRVRRMSDDSEQNFGFNSDGELKTQSIEDWLSGADGRVVEWYSQVEGHPALVPDDGTRAPYIARDGQVFVTDDGRPHVRFNGQSVLEPSGNLPSAFSIDDVSVSLVAETTGGNEWGGGIQLLMFEPDGDWTHDRPELVARKDDGDYKVRKLRVTSGGVVSTGWEWQVLTISLSGSQFLAYSNDDEVQSFSDPVTNDSRSRRFQLGGTPNDGAWEGNIGELVMYSAVSGDNEHSSRLGLIDSYWDVNGDGTKNDGSNDDGSGDSGSEEDRPETLARNDEATVKEDESITIDVLGNDASSVSIESVSDPDHGSSSVTNGDEIRYTPDDDYNGGDEFTYTVKSSWGVTETATVSLTVGPQNDAPSITSEAPTKVNVHSRYTYDIEASDVDGDRLSFSADGLPDWVSLNQTGDTTAKIDGTPGDGDVGSYSVTLEVSDGTSTARQRYSIEVTSDRSESPSDVPTVNTVERDVSKGWNLVGLPFEVDDSRRSTVYPGATQNTLYAFTDDLVRKRSLEPGTGYFLHYGGSESVSLSGDEVEKVSFSLNPGWNLVSGPSCTVPLDAVQDPDNVINEVAIFAFATQYVVSDEFKPAQGYWVSASKSGKITLDCSQLDSAGKTGKTRKLADEAIENHDALEISDASGASQTLYFNEVDDGSNASASKKEVSFPMPPLPPEGTFDARFSGQKRLIDGVSGTIQLQSSSYPITVKLTSASVGTRSYVVEELQGQNVVKTHQLTGSGTVEITNADVGRLQISDAASAAAQEIPENFQLHGNYPNPFNPQTNISFSLPEQADVKVTVYNTVGARVMQTSSTTMSAGQQTMSLDGSSLSSGVYLYRVTMTTANNVQTKVGQMTLLK